MATSGFLHVMCRKTKMCKYFARGRCTRQPCDFAHSLEELQPVPNLSCTKVCPTLLRTGRCEDSSCTFAHRRSELRRLPSSRSGYSLQKVNAPRSPRSRVTGANFSRQTTPGGLTRQELYEFGDEPERCFSTPGGGSQGASTEDDEAEEEWEPMGAQFSGLLSPGCNSDDEGARFLEFQYGDSAHDSLSWEAPFHPLATEVPQTELQPLPTVRIKNTFLTVDEQSGPSPTQLPRPNTMPDLTARTQSWPDGEEMCASKSEVPDRQDSTRSGSTRSGSRSSIWTSGSDLFVQQEESCIFVHVKNTFLSVDLPPSVKPPSRSFSEPDLLANPLEPCEAHFCRSASDAAKEDTVSGLVNGQSKGLNGAQHGLLPSRRARRRKVRQAARRIHDNMGFPEPEDEPEVVMEDAVRPMRTM